jgi:hypothetical protein
MKCGTRPTVDVVFFSGGDQSLAQLEDHLTVLRKLERRLDRLIDQPRVSALRPLHVTGCNEGIERADE